MIIKNIFKTYQCNFIAINLTELVRVRYSKQKLQLCLCLAFPTWMSTLIYQSQKLSTYTYKKSVFYLCIYIYG